MIRRILVPLDGSRLALQVIAPLRRLLDGDVELTLLRVVEPRSPVNHDRGTAAEVSMQAQLVQVQESLGLGVRARTQLVRGDAAAEIVRYAVEAEQDLVAMATHGRTGLERVVRGSVAEQVLRTCARPLLLCNPRAMEPRRTGPVRRILVPLDGSPLADGVLPLVEAVAKASGARVTLLRVEPMVVSELPSPILAGSLWDPGAAAASLSPQRDRLAAAGLDVEAAAAYGVVAAEVLRAAEDVDLLAIATHGRSGVARWWFGSVAEDVLRAAPCPLLVLRTATPPAG